ncbi:hypothetical protein HZH66_004497 [Vespula vulgaris]|uniref:HYR domain-containing protein n=1 Tax=Vespula vulgaris TaxID=7454 RepID=A0A834KF22_VESVU|nr:hypothetical protein HZH66_004497 [Vespula vulgaris]
MQIREDSRMVKLLCKGGCSSSKKRPTPLISATERFQKDLIKCVSRTCLGTMPDTNEQTMRGRWGNREEGEAPKVKDCPNNIDVTGKNGTSITWTEPIFTDNVKVTRISSNESPGRPFDVGGHRIEYEASDEAGWSSKCVFTVVLRAE